MKKHFFSFLIIFAAAAGLCGCSSVSPPQESSVSETTAADVSVTEGSESSAAAEQEAEQEKDVPPMDVSPITFSLFILKGENSLPSDSGILDEITGRTGVTLEITEGGEDALDALIASGELPDLIFAGERTDGLAADGTLLPLDGYIPDLGGKFSAMYGEALDAMRKTDGKIYTFGTGGSSPERLYADGFFGIRYEVLEELGYPEIKTLEQLENALAAYKEKHPRSTGLLLCGAPREQWHDTVSARISYIYGCPDDGDFFVENGKVTYKWDDPRAKAYIGWLNGLYGKGLLDSKSFSLKHAAYLDRVSSRYIAAVAAPAEVPEDTADSDAPESAGDDVSPAAAAPVSVVMYYNERPAAIADDYDDFKDTVEKLPEELRFCPLAVTADGTKPVIFTAEAFVPADGIGITTACKAPERAFRFLDWLCGDEAQFLLNFGKDGSFDPENGRAPAAEPFPMRGVGEKAPDGRFYSYAAEKFISGYSEYEKRAAETYGVRAFTEQYEIRRLDRASARNTEFPSHSEAAVLSEALETYVKAEIPNIIAAPEEEFEKRWKEMTDWCEEHGSERLCELMEKELFG